MASIHSHNSVHSALSSEILNLLNAQQLGLRNPVFDSTLFQMNPILGGQSSAAVEMLLLKFKFLQQARVRAEAEALAAAAVVELTLPIPRQNAMKVAEFSPFTSPGEACSVMDNMKASHNLDVDIFQEVNSEKGSAAVIPDLLPELDVDESDWCDNMLAAQSQPTTPLGKELNSGNSDIQTNFKQSTPSDNQVQAEGRKRRHFSEAELCGQNFNEHANNLCEDFERVGSRPSTRRKQAEDTESGENFYSSDESSPKARSEQKQKKLRQKRGTATDPQSMAARARREKIASRMRKLTAIVPGTDKLDTATMLEQAIQYVRDLQSIVDKAKAAKKES